jgi:hypothetical protein
MRFVLGVVNEQPALTPQVTLRPDVVMARKSMLLPYSSFDVLALSEMSSVALTTSNQISALTSNQSASRASEALITHLPTPLVALTLMVF